MNTTLKRIEERSAVLVKFKNLRHLTFTKNKAEEMLKPDDLKRWGESNHITQLKELLNGMFNGFLNGRA